NTNSAMKNPLIEATDTYQETLTGAWKAVKPVLLMVTVQIAFAWASVFYKLALNDNMKFSSLI
ncbi:unnamed protein product, partial [Sphenostylis stenocarpa]